MTNYTKEEMENIIVEASKALAEKKAENILALDLEEVNSYLDYFIIATANSNIHGSALIAEINSKLKEKGFTSYSKDIRSTGWQVLDFGSIIVHVFTEEYREYYKLEKLWGDAKVVFQG